MTLIKQSVLQENIEADFCYFGKSGLLQLKEKVKLGSNEFSMNIVTVDLTELTRNILIDWIPIFEDTQNDFTIDIPERFFRVKLDYNDFSYVYCLDCWIYYSKGRKR